MNLQEKVYRLGILFWAYVDGDMQLHIVRAYSKTRSEKSREIARTYNIHVFDLFYAHDYSDAKSKIYPEYMDFMKKYQEM